MRLICPHPTSLSAQDIKFPKVRGNYKGVAPLPQIMRKKGVPPPQPPNAAGGTDSTTTDSPAAAAAGSSKPFVEEVIVEETPAELLPAPAYAVEPRSLGRQGGRHGLEGERGGTSKPDGLSLKVWEQGGRGRGRGREGRAGQGRDG